MGKFKDLTGRVFGRLTVIEPTDQRKQGAVVWKCKCICGNEVLVSRSNLEQKNTLSCGCLQAENVSKRNKKNFTKNIKGQKFGRLTAIEPTNQRSHGYIIWRCNCECGNKNIYVNLHNLISGNTLSCGCFSSEVSKKIATKYFAKYKEDNYIAKTRLDIINKTKLNKNNTTGYRGVYLRKKDGKYVVYITFQQIKYFLGSYFTKEDAIKVRKEAEEKLYGDFLKWYNSTKDKHKTKAKQKQNKL